MSSHIMGHYFTISQFYFGTLYMANVANGLGVLIVGFGFMGENHFNNLVEIQKKTGQVYVAGVVDIDPKKLENKKLTEIADRCFVSLEKAFEGDKSYDIVVVVTNTATHNAIIQEIFARCAAQGKKLPALFAEKPLVENTLQAMEVVKRLEEAGYGKKIPFTCGYIFRESPALDACLKYIQDNQLQIEKIETVWQKLRVPSRPSAGVHIDEATHPVDILLNYIFPTLGLSNNELKLKVLLRDYARTIVDEKLQDSLYGSDHIPLATVDYTMNIGGIPVKAHSSFNEAPQRREILIDCGNEMTLKVSFDDQKSDTFTVFVSGETVLCTPFKDPNKLMLEWETFLQNYRQLNDPANAIAPSPKIPTLQDALRDIQITEMLGSLEIGVEQEILF